MIIAQPDFLLVDAQRPYADHLAHPMLQHPALKELFPADAVITIPDSLFQCAGPSLIEAFSLMATALTNNSINNLNNPLNKNLNAQHDSDE